MTWLKIAMALGVLVIVGWLISLEIPVLGVLLQIGLMAVIVLFSLWLLWRLSQRFLWRVSRRLAFSYFLI
jgi:hypothetical protein